ncbi:phospholipid scramblase 2-like [Epargyreus clarus]|uniref:phospholipid scramblase 2-like n=1 Tax=Epargyreus clarus TaxID=520877 RepID=UPI003C2B55E1
MQEDSEGTELIITETGGWMPCPKIEMTHPGLAYFCPLDKLIVIAKLDPLHELIGEADVGYTIFNNEGQKVFLAVQENKDQKFNIKMFNVYGNEVVELKKRFKLCFNKIHIWAPQGNFVGSAEEVWSCVKNFVVKDSLQKSILKIQPREIPYQQDYDIICDGEKVGLVTNRWRFRSILNMKSFGVSFPICMSVEYKVLLLGATFLIGCLKY